jgi:hypothetical protein
VLCVLGAACYVILKQKKIVVAGSSDFKIRPHLFVLNEISSESDRSRSFSFARASGTRQGLGFFEVLNMQLDVP